MRKVALIGLPNSGKSTLFNRLTKRKAIVSKVAGTTRDVLRGVADFGSGKAEILDTGGIIRSDEALDQQVIAKALAVAAEADLIVYLVDGLAAVTDEDLRLAKQIRRLDKPIVLAVNKMDQPKKYDAAEYQRLGFSQVVEVSAEQGMGIKELTKAINEVLPKSEEDDEEGVRRTALALIGRPNTGKSSLLNALCGEERAIVSEVAGTTRDAVDTDLDIDGLHLRLIDTAGLRRRGKVGRGIEFYSKVRLKKALEQADIALLLIDAVEGLTKQDKHMAELIERYGTGCIIVVNKWDIKPEGTELLAVEQIIRGDMPFLRYAPIVYVSAKTKKGIGKLLPEIPRVMESKRIEIKTSDLNKWLTKAVADHKPRRGGTPHYMVQTATDPPEFALFVRNPEEIHFSYTRYIKNCLRKEWGFYGTPIQVEWRQK